MENIQLKYNLLDTASKKEVQDFIDFLLSKKQKKKPVSSYKKKIMEVSTWSEKDVEYLKATQKYMNNWMPEKW